jgi:outer membrane protein TolC
VDTPAVREELRLTLVDALLRGVEDSEDVLLARGAIRQASGQYREARSALLPQLSGSVGYTRTLESQFEGFGGGQQQPDTLPGGIPVSECGPYRPLPDAPPGIRLDSISKALLCSQVATGSPFDGFQDVGFGSENTYRAALSLSQSVWAGGRNWDRLAAAEASRDATALELTMSQAGTALDVIGSYYGVLLAERLATIAREALEQAEETLATVTRANEVGLRSDFDLLRARVARDNQRPVVIQRDSELELARLRLKQQLDLPSTRPVRLTSELDALPEPLPSEVTGVVGSARVEPGDTSSGARAPVRQAGHRARAAAEQLEAAEAARWPSIGLTSSYAKLAYPRSGLPDTDDLRTDWTVGITVRVPIFQGGAIPAREAQAEARLVQARARLAQARELAALDAERARTRLATARAALEASRETVEQAREAYRIAEVRYEQGLSTYVELSDTRLSLSRARANRARAARDLQVARARLLLLPYLPLQARQGAGAAGAQGGTGAGAGFGDGTDPQQATSPGRPGGGGATGVAGPGAAGSRPGGADPMVGGTGGGR